ncbi:MAG: AAA family ATPase [Candidatus Cardinium sp.]|nr:AAA family ATPase [Candidatus Cardinium sp.]
MMRDKSKPKIKVGTDDFKTLLLNSDVFVDKSLMIQALLEESSEAMLITRPRRWGKSLNMDMLRKFFEIEVNERGEPLPEAAGINRLLFTGGTIDTGFGETRVLQPLKIASHPKAIKRQANFPVILFNLKDVKGNSYQEIEEGVSINIKKLYKQYQYLAYSIHLSKEEQQDFRQHLLGDISKAQLKVSLAFLSELLYRHFGQKVYILIDEYDTPINTSYLKFENRIDEWEEVLELFRNMLGSVLKSNSCLEKGVITGILHIAKANLFSDLNNIREYTLLDKKFNKFYGFTQEEVDGLLHKVPTQTAPEKIKDWYNGYTFGGEIIYNLWSIMQCLASEGALDYYWLDSGGTGLVDKALLTDTIQEDIKQLLEGKHIVKKIYKQITLGEIEDNSYAFYSLLLFAGYLSPALASDAIEEEPTYCLSIPNKEVRKIYMERICQWVTKRLDMPIASYDSFMKLLITGQIDAFGAQLQTYLLQSTSYHDLSQEKDYHNLISGLLAPLANRFHITSNRETGYGRCDHLLLPIVGYGGHAVLMEHKIAKAPKEIKTIAQQGLEQILNQ